MKILGGVNFYIFFHSNFSTFMARYGDGIWKFSFFDLFWGVGVVKKTQEIWIWGGSTSVRSQKGGVHMVAVKNGGGVLGCKQNWGGVGRRPSILYTPPSG